MMKPVIISLLMCLWSVAIWAAPYRTTMIDTHIAALQVNVTGEDYSFPVIELNGSNTIDISFDELSYDAKNYYYKIVHCNSAWEPSSLSEMEYISGFSSSTIDEYEYSINTSQNYIHYNLQLPNDGAQLLISGNYAVIIAENNNFDEPVAVACFSVYEPLTQISIDQRGNTDLEINGRYQQLDIEVSYAELSVTDPMTELILAVYQNGRYDNAVIGIRPTYLQHKKIIFKNSRPLIFEGGNSYRALDFSSQYTYGNGIDRITFADGLYHVDVEPAQLRNGVNADLTQDVDGAMVVHKQQSDDSNVEADYFWVHFTLPWTNPLPQGGVYILGDFNHNQFDSFVRMDYQDGMFTKSILLKQGGYNYLYVVRRSGDENVSLQPIEGSFWQTQNSYQVFIYFRPFGARYDRLVGYKVQS